MPVMNKAETKKYLIRQLDQSYTVQAAFLHQRMLADDVLPALGFQFLVHYYQYALRDSSQVILGALEDDKLVGFCQLSFEPISTLAIIRSFPFILGRLLWMGVRHPILFLRGVLAAFTRHKLIAEAAEISFIVVDSARQRCGIGKQLILEAGRVVRNRGCTNVTTKTANEIARSIYEKSFTARVVATSSFLGKRYWYLSWAADQAGEAGR